MGGLNLKEQVKLIQESIKLNIKNKDYGLVRNDYLNISFLFKREKNQIERLRYLLLVIYLDLSGMSNGNTVDSYGVFKSVFDTSIWKEINIAKRKSKIDDSIFLQIFDELISTCKIDLPFLYFDIDIMKKIIIDNLHGETNLLEKYKDYLHEPELNNPNYCFHDFRPTISKIEKQELKVRLDRDHEIYKEKVERLKCVDTIKREKGNSLIIIPENYTLVDLETTGLSAKYNNIIEVGCIKIRNGKIVDKYQTLVKPPEPIPYIIECMTGIKNDMVSNAPVFKEIAQSIWDFLENEIIVGHNVSFDINFLYDNFFNVLNKKFQNDWVDTLRLSRKIVQDVERHGLMDLCRYFDVALELEGDFKDDLEKISATLELNMFPNHRAINDCLLANGILNGLSDKIKKDEIDLAKLFEGKSYKYNFSKITGDENFFNKDHIFYGKNCVFTGKLEKFTRKEAAQIVANIGGHCENTVTKNTNFLIVGDMDYRNGMQGNKTAKLKKAEQFIEDKQELQILPESAFYDLIVDYVQD